MSELLDLAIAAHGGMPSWRQIRTCTVHFTISGPLLAMKGAAGILGQAGSECLSRGDVNAQRVTIAPFMPTGRHGVSAPDRIALVADDGRLIEERLNPRVSLVRRSRGSPWDELDVVYFLGYASWNDFTLPFVLSRPDVTVEEEAPWLEDGQTWRSLRAVFPDSVATHTREQVFYFDERGLLQRHDYAVDILGSVPVAHYVYDYRAFDGIMMPTHRRAFARQPDGRPDRTKMSFAIDIIEMTFES